ncbi:MAG: hypothetical protein SVK54_08345 [candidate division WOR-3 bacterium]|nr:hypothetical protein [candidate division WOR-3 bacterium]
MNYHTFHNSLKDISKNTEYHFYLIGGFVRDRLLGIENLTDIDIAVEYHFEEFLKVFNEYFETKPQMISRFKTAAYSIDGLRVDIITARREDYDSPGVLPDIEPAGIEDDIERRDFTINSMAMMPETEEIIDNLGGLDDLRSGLVRANRKGLFTEDPTRIFRLFKYSNRLKFDIEKNTFIQLQESLKNEDLFSNVSKSRISSEWKTLINDRGASASLMELDRYSVIERIMGSKVIFNHCSLTGLSDFEKTVLIFIDNDKQIIDICDILLNGVKKIEKDMILSLTELHRRGVITNSRIMEKYPALVRRIQT